jgi:putative membrane protein
MVLFWGAIIWLIAWAVSQFSRGGGGSHDGALDIAKRRYARGEIDREQYEQLRKDLA